MDTKLKKCKNNKNKIVANLLVLIVLLLASLGIMTTYKNAEDISYTNKDVFNNEEIAEYFAGEYYNIYWNMKKNTEDIYSPSDLFLNEKDINRYSKDIDMDSIEGSVEEDSNGNIIVKKEDLIDDFNKAFLDNGENILDNNLIKYNIYNKSNKKTYANENKDLKDIKEYSLNDKYEKDYSKEERIEKLSRKYMFFMTVDFDKDGNATIKSLHGADKENYQALENYINNSEITGEYLVRNSDEYIKYKLKPIKDTTMTIAVNNKDINQVLKGTLSYLNGSSSQYFLTHMLSKNKMDSYRQIIMYAATIAITITLIGLILPNSIRNDIFGMGKIIKIPIEILFFIGSMIIAGFVAFSPELLLNISIEDVLYNEILNLLPVTSSVSEMLVILINIVYWMLFFGIDIMGGIYIRDMILSKEDRKIIFKSSIIVKLIIFIKKQVKLFLNWLNKLDLNSGREKLILACLAINFVLIIIFCSMAGFGVILAIIYTVVLYKLIKKKTSKVFEDYDKLEKITRDIANGDFKEISDEDLGIFNPIKENLQNIKVGFSNAVNEEVKSQKMKTELITNVSHDLKTPLTSIITYVDLLKKEDITEEERKKYLETIEKKSNRLKFLIEDLFEVSKATSGNITMNPMKVDVVSLVKQTIIELEDKLNAAHLEIKTDFPSEKVILELDSMRTFRIFSNLISNISKYSMPYTRVYISIRKNEETTEIEFKNISAEELNCNVENLTERFVRGDKSRNTEGSGLGLAIAKSFTELQDGKMKISSDGDLFKVILIFKNN